MDEHVNCSDLSAIVVRTTKVDRARMLKISIFDAAFLPIWKVTWRVQRSWAEAMQFGCDIIFGIIITTHA